MYALKLANGIAKFLYHTIEEENGYLMNNEAVLRNNGAFQASLP